MDRPGFKGRWSIMECQGPISSEKKQILNYSKLYPNLQCQGTSLETKTKYVRSSNKVSKGFRKSVFNIVERSSVIARFIFNYFISTVSSGIIYTLLVQSNTTVWKIMSPRFFVPYFYHCDYYEILFHEEILTYKFYLILEFFEWVCSLD